MYLTQSQLKQIIKEEYARLLIKEYAEGPSHAKRIENEIELNKKKDSSCPSGWSSTWTAKHPSGTSFKRSGCVLHSRRDAASMGRRTRGALEPTPIPVAPKRRKRRPEPKHMELGGYGLPIELEKPGVMCPLCWSVGYPSILRNLQEHLKRAVSVTEMLSYIKNPDAVVDGTRQSLYIARKLRRELRPSYIGLDAEQRALVRSWAKRIHRDIPARSAPGGIQKKMIHKAFPAKTASTKLSPAGREVGPRKQHGTPDDPECRWADPPIPGCSWYDEFKGEWVQIPWGPSRYLREALTKSKLERLIKEELEILLS